MNCHFFQLLHNTGKNVLKCYQQLFDSYNPFNCSIKLYILTHSLCNLQPGANSYKSGSVSGATLFDTLMIFLKDGLEKDYF